MSTPPTESISSLKRSKSTKATWLTSSPVRLFTVFSASTGPPICERGVDLPAPVAGDVDAQVARDREERESVAARVGADEHDRVRPACVAASGLGAAVGAEDEDRGRCRRQHPALALQFREHRLRDARIRVGDATGDREVARDEPGDPEQEDDGERDRDPAPDVALARLRLRALRGVGTTVRRAPQRDLSLRPTAPVQLVGLLLFGHPGGYRSRDVSEERVIGVDLGGTKILAGLVARDGAIGRTIEIATPAGGQQEVLAAMDGVVADLVGDGAGAIGYGVPLNIDRRTGVALKAVNLPLHDVHFPEPGQGAVRPACGVENDGNAAALAEWRLGAGRDVSNLIMLTLGTGVGGGIVIDDRLYRGWAELGHSVVIAGRPALPGELPRSRARRGARLGHAANRAAVELYGRGADAPVLLAKAREGDPRAIDALAEIGRILGAAIGSWVNIFDPDIVVVGGGFGAAAGDLVLEPARDRPRAEALQPADETLQIVEAELGDEAGLIGAGSSRSRRSTGCGDARPLRDADRQPRRRDAARAGRARVRRRRPLRGHTAHEDPARAPRRSARLLSYHQHNEASRVAELVPRLVAGERMALVSDAGLPGVNDPGARLVAAARELPASP